jgi:hypothetical protein
LCYDDCNKWHKCRAIISFIKVYVGKAKNQEIKAKKSPAALPAGKHIVEVRATDRYGRFFFALSQYEKNDLNACRCQTALHSFRLHIALGMLIIHKTCGD